MTENNGIKKFLKIFEWNRVASIITPIVGIFIGLFLTAFILLSQNINPLTAYGSMFKGAFVGISNLSFTLLQFIPLGLAGLAVTIAYRCGTFNIGVEGQLYMGALFTTWLAVSFPEMPGFILLPLCIIVGMLAGGLFAAIPAYLKAKHGMNEVLICMLLNYVGINMVGLAVNSFLKEPGQPNPVSAMLSKSTWLPILIPKTYLHVGFLFVFIIAILMCFVLFKTTMGYAVRSVGLSQKASTYSGIGVNKTMIGSMIVSGMIAGLAGSLEIMGNQHRLLANFLVGYGYDAISVSLLGGLHPIGVLATAFLFGALKNGGNAMQIAMGIPVSVVSIVNAIAILSIIAISQIRVLYFKRKKGERKS